MNEREMQNRLDELPNEKKEEWERAVLAAQEKNLAAKEAALIFLFKEDLENMKSWDNPILEMRGFFLFQMVYFSEEISEIGLKEIKEITLKFLEIIIPRISLYTENIENEEEINKILNLLYDSECFIREYEGALNHKIKGINREVLFKCLAY